MANSKPKAEAADAVLDTKSDLLAELAEHAEATRPDLAPTAPAVERLTNGTIVSTETVYDDRTFKPEVDKVVEYASDDVDLGNGTILTNIGEALSA